MKNKVLAFLILIATSLFANDGAYYASGNQLIPIEETDICITKEVLSIIRKKELTPIDGYDVEYIYVTVDYTFFNQAKNEKEILVGFEAPSPVGDVDGYPVNGRHPYISDFNVMMNGTSLNHQTAIVNEEVYFINNKIDAKTEEEVIGSDFNANEADFYYVYHFKAKFKPGLNKIVHTYKFTLSTSVMERYNFEYILTAANRWANHQIDDFTLNIEMGDSESFYVYNTFFDEKDKWIITEGRKMNTINNDNQKIVSQFITYSGSISYKKKNFKPKGELALYALQEFPRLNNIESFNYKNHDTPPNVVMASTASAVYDFDSLIFFTARSVDENSFKILRNLPFAIKGYVFKTKMIQDYYLTQKWYIPKPEYISDIENLSKEEKEWIKEVKFNKWD